MAHSNSHSTSLYVKHVLFSVMTKSDNCSGGESVVLERESEGIGSGV